MVLILDRTMIGGKEEHDNEESTTVKHVSQLTSSACTTLAYSNWKGLGIILE